MTPAMLRRTLALAVLSLALWPPPARAADEHLATAKLQKAAVACQKVIAQVGAKIGAGKLKALDSCANTALTCVQTKHDKPECLTKAGATCAKQLDKAALALTKAQAKIVGAKSCATELRLPDVLSADGLGLGDLAGDCETDFGLDVCAGLEPLAACVVRTRDRAAGVIYGEARPRTTELLTLLPNVVLPPIAGLPPFAGCGSCSAPPESRKAVEQCGKTLTKARQGLGASLDKTLAACAQKVLGCVQIKSDDPKCLTAATAGCSKATGKVAAALAKFAAAVVKKCDAAAVGFSVLGDPSGLGLAPLASVCPSAPTDATSLAACLQARARCTTAELVRTAVARVGAFAESGHFGTLSGDLTATCPAPPAMLTVRTAAGSRAVFGSIRKFLKQVRRPGFGNGALVGGGRPNPSLGAGRGITRTSGPPRVSFGGIGKIQFRYKVGSALGRGPRITEPPTLLVVIQRADVSLDDHFEVTLDPPVGVPEVDDEIEVTYQDTIPGCAFSIALATRIDGIVSEYTPVLQVVDLPQPTPTSTAATPSPTATATPAPGTVTEIIDATGDGIGHAFTEPYGVTLDGLGNTYVSGGETDNVFKITSGGVITQIIDATGDGAGNPLDFPASVAVDGTGNVYVAGSASNNVFKITPGGTITEIIDGTGDGAGNALTGPLGLAVDGSDNVYVVAFSSNNVFKITGATISEIIDANGDGIGNTLSQAQGVAVDGSENVYVSGKLSNNVFKIESGGMITEIIDATGGGVATLAAPEQVAVDGTGNVFVAGTGSDNVFKIASGGAVTEIIDASGDGAGNFLDGAFALSVDGPGNLYVTGANSQNVFKITPADVITEIADASGDGSGNLLLFPSAAAVDGAGNVYVTGLTSDNAFQITPGG